MIITQDFSAAKNIVDFYTSKLTDDVESQNAPFALQYSHLKLLRLRTNASLNILESYPIEAN